MALARVDDSRAVALARAALQDEQKQAQQLTSALTAGADVVVLDLTLGDGATVTENVTRLVADGSSVIIHSVADRPASVREALAAGAAGIVSKSSRIDDVLHAVSSVAQGEPLNNVEWASAVEGDRGWSSGAWRRRPASEVSMFASLRQRSACALRQRSSKLEDKCSLH